MDIAKNDKNMAVVNQTEDGMDWYKVTDPGFQLDGNYWFAKTGLFKRFPLNDPELQIPENADDLSWHTAGEMLRFRSDAKEIRIRVKVYHTARMDHMAMVGSMGFDLYVGEQTKKQYVRSSRFDFNQDEYLVTVFGPFPERKMHEFTLHFPLYSGVEEFAIGLDNGSAVEAPTPWKDPRPVVMYGTSIQQGGCASRPGMCHTNRMSRLLDRPFLNYAFSGSGCGEPEAAKMLAMIEDPAMYILDYDANSRPNLMQENLPVFIDILREKHPDTPILLVSRILYAGELFGIPGEVAMRKGYTDVHLKEYTKRRAAGDENIYFLDGATLLGPEPSECTVDGVHGTDLGFYLIANNMAPVVQRILG